jgi:GT2 family glycosyltransferase/nucleoside phosphorylase
MKRNNYLEIQLVVTAALKKEIPAEWFRAQGIAVHRLAALRSGVLSDSKENQRGMLVVITGAGLKASEEAACWIRDHLSPLYVLNIGTCGAPGRTLSRTSWVQPQSVSLQSGEELQLDTRLPIPCAVPVQPVPSLLSAEKAHVGDVPRSRASHAIIDMECYAQAQVFAGTGTTFHCLKFVTDHADADARDDFNRSLEAFRESGKELFRFLAESDLQGEVTVIIPVYNRENVLGRAIDSVLAQSLRPAEVIVVDDGSDDGTAAVIESYDDVIESVVLEKQSGPSRARNEGVHLARTAWIAFLDSDDCWERHKLKHQAAWLKRYPFYQILQSDEKWIRKGKRVNPCRHHQKPLGWVWEQSLQRCLISPSGVLMKRSLFNYFHGFDEMLPVCEDYDLWLKISRWHPVGLTQALDVVKYGGHKDQLSQAFHSMDTFRVQSLLRQLAQEPSEAFRRLMTCSLEKKLTVLIKGSEKRQKHREAAAYRSVMETLGRSPGV